jgi:hypothetical protein
MESGMSKKNQTKPWITVCRRGQEAEWSEYVVPWNVVEVDPDYKATDSGVEIKANIAVNKDAERQSGIKVLVSEDALIDLFESYFMIEGFGLGNFVKRVCRSMKASNDALVQSRAANRNLLRALDASTGESIDWSDWDWRGYFDPLHYLASIPSSKKVFDDHSRELLKILKRHKWDQ